MARTTFSPWPAAALTLMATASALLANGCSGSSEAPPGDGTASAAQALETPKNPLVRPATKHPSGAALTRVMVALSGTYLPEGKLSDVEVVLQRQRIADAQARIISLLGAATGKPEAKDSARVTQRYTAVPGLALELTPDALAKLQSSSDVGRLLDDGLVPATLMQTTGPSPTATDARRANLLPGGPRGRGQVVAVLDTGVDRNHPFLGTERFVAGACFSSGSWGGFPESGVCPGGSNRELGDEAGENCSSSIDGCRHGTHVAGIVGGFEDTSGNGRLDTEDRAGVAPDVSFVAVQVFHSMNVAAVCEAMGSAAPCALANDSDIIAGLDHVETLTKRHSIAAVNLSLGGGWFNDQRTCDSLFWLTKWAVDDLFSKDVATVVASANEATVGPIPFVPGVGQPACISGVVSVGNIRDNGSINPTSQSAPFLTLLAPGTSVRSSVPGTGFASFNGTSMAAPHVAGTFALMRERRAQTGEPTAIASMVGALRSSGRPVLDARNAVITPALDVPLALGMPFVALTGPETATATSPTPVTLDYALERRGVPGPFEVRTTVETLGRGTLTVTTQGNPVAGARATLQVTPSLDAMGTFVLHVRGVAGVADVIGADTTIEVNPAQPLVTGFAPASGPPTTAVTVDGGGFSSLTRIRFGNGPLVSGTVVSPSRMVVRVPLGALTGRVQAVNGTRVSNSASVFTVTTAPAIASVSPRYAPEGAPIVVNGANFAPDTQVRTGAVSVADLSIESSEVLRFRIPTGATGTLRITTSAGSATSTMTVGYPTPTLTSFAPTIGHTGQTVTIVGSGFFGSPLVRFGAVRGTVTFVSPTSMRVLVPTNVPDSAPITVLTPGGSATSIGRFQTDQ